MNVKNWQVGDTACKRARPGDDYFRFGKILMIDNQSLLVEWNDGVLNYPSKPFPNKQLDITRELISNVITEEAAQLALEEMTYRNAKLEKEFAKVRITIIKKFEAAAKNIEEAGKIANKYKDIYKPDSDMKVIGHAISNAGWFTSMIEC